MPDVLLRTGVTVVYAGVNISREISDDLISITVTDNEGSKVDDLEIVLKNNHGLWSKDWSPEFGDTIEVTIWQEGRDRGPDLQCGVFQVDEIEFDGPPATLHIKALSLPFDAGITRHDKTKAWEKFTLSRITKEIAGHAGLQAQYIAATDPLYDRRDQREESDLVFLKRLCDDEAFEVKISDKKLIVFSPEERGKSDPVATLNAGYANVNSFRFSRQNHDLYGTVTVEYKEPKSGKINSYTYTNSAIQKGKTFKIKSRVSSLAEAQKRAKAKLFSLNRKSGEGSLNLVGNTLLVAGATVEIYGFGGFNGKYYIAKATHSVSNGGYTTSIDLNNTLGGETSGDVDYVGPAGKKKSAKGKSSGGDNSGHLYTTVEEVEKAYNAKQR